MQSEDKNRFLWNPPSSISKIKEIEATLGVRLPEEYINFLCISNGCEGFLKNGDYVNLDPIEMLIERNTELCVNECAPGIVIVGSDGGGEAVAFDTQSSDFPLVLIPFVTLDREDIWPFTDSFTEFLKLLPDKSDV